ncbi:MAG TPA: hypothetical protein VGI73_03040 [Solirubrobacterales bacterium]|jgi:hypothetical protein
MARFRPAYDDSPLHLLATLASFAIAGYAFLRIVENPSALGTLVWFAGAAVAHDLIAFPLYSALNLIAQRSIEGPNEAWEESRRVPLINHVRIPAFLSALALLMFFPLILGLDSANYEKDAGLSPDVFLTRWLGLCAALFLGSAVIYAVRLRRATRGDEDEPADAPGPRPEGS